MKITITTALRLLAALSMLAAMYKKEQESDTEISAFTTTCGVYVLVFAVAGISGVALLFFFNVLGVLIIMSALTFILSAAVIVSMGGEQEDEDEDSGPDYTVPIDRID